MKDELEVYIEIQGGLHYVIKKSRGIKVTVVDLDTQSNSEQLLAGDAVIPAEGWQPKVVYHVVDDVDIMLDLP